MNDLFKALLAAFAFAILAFFVHTVVAIATMNYYTMPEYFSVWSKVMMPTAGPPPTSFYFMSFIFSLVGGGLFTAGYLWTKKAFTGKTWQKGAFYGALVFAIAAVPGTLSMYLLINLPLMLMIWWAIENLVIYVVAGAAIAKVVELK